jgi:1-deoxy-D-xylulose-5-phosphate reductoisomerase
MATERLSLLGSTGSIGTQTLDVVDRFADRFEVVALGAGRCSEQLVDQVRRFHPDLVVVASGEAASELGRLVGSDVEVMVGRPGLEAAAGAGDVVINAVVGFAGLPVTLAALGAGKRLGLANKESLIAAAPVVERVRATPGAVLIPVDSEHCAIHQCLAGVPEADRGHALRRLVLTASGGPFRTASAAELDVASVADALAHPTWDMGPKITVDSSTLMNKGLEVIEAHALFGVSFDRIDVVIHPQSIVHSMVELVDGSTIAQLSQPDMRLPIAYALGFPERLDGGYGSLDFASGVELTFEAPDTERFACLGLAYEAGRLGGAAPAWLSAANEVAVEAFLAERLSWRGIAELVAETLAAYEPDPLESLEAVLQADARARDVAAALLAARMEP